MIRLPLRRRPVKILIAEDDLVSRRTLERAVQAWGHEAVTVGTGGEALAALEDPDGPALGLLDWELPDVDGPAICRSVRGGEEGSPPRYLILVTGRAESTDIASGLESGADDYVTKPFHPVELRARVRVGERILALRREAVERERFQGALEMAGAVCHEFNQPLQVVRGWTDLLLEEADPECGSADALRSIDVAVERLGELTRKIQRLTRYRSKPYLSGGARIIDLEEAARS